MQSAVDMDGAGFGTLWRLERSGIKIGHPRGQRDLLASPGEDGFEIASTGREQVDVMCRRAQHSLLNKRILSRAVETRSWLMPSG